LALDQLNIDQVPTDAEIWERVIRKLQAGVMPPPGRPRPDAATYASLVRTISDALDRAATAAPDPGRPALHRLNRVEYANAIHDLLSVDIDAAGVLPADDSGYGFDNVADVLKVSPRLMESYILAAKQISRLAIGDTVVGRAVSTYDVPYMILVQDERISESLPFGSRGGISVRHYFPLDGDYELSIRLQRNSLAIGHEIRGLDVANQIDVRLDRQRLKLFTMGVRKYGVSSYTVNEDAEDAGLRVRFRTTAGPHVVGVTFQKDTWYVEGVGMSRLPPASDGYASGRMTETGYGRVDMGVDRLDIEGPFDGRVPAASASRRKIFVCHPATADEEPCARQILGRLARAAYRRPTSTGDVETLMEFFRNGRAEGTFDVGIERALMRLLASPDFIFRIETDPPSATPGQVHPVTDLALASRLSFFLWSSIPDETLIELAARGDLHKTIVLKQQVQRMLADPRARALVTNFFGQWLMIRNMEAVRPDPRAFPQFDENLRDAFQQETALFLEAQLVEDRPVTELLTADYTFVNERLAKHYGIPDVYGLRFRRVRLPDGTRGGILGQGSVLTVTSYPNRTSPVVRGKFLLENILGTPPPPPPPNVPPLDRTQVTGSLRQRMELHRKNPVCAACHSQLDPLGFALENFDGIGMYRTNDGGGTVDPSGTLPDGTAFDAPAAFRKALMSRQDAFLTTLTQKLLTYALGRGVEYRDMPAVRAIVDAARKDDLRWSALVTAIVQSPPFRLRRAA
jgi:hypothetical protein